MNIVFFELEGWEQPFLEKSLPGHALTFLQHPLSSADSAVIANANVLCPFIFSQIKADAMGLAKHLKLITTRSTGFDHVDCALARQSGIAVSNVPEYGSNTVAEHTIALLLALSRRIIPAYIRTKGSSFSTAGLRGFDLSGKTIGIVGTGNIGLHVIRMALGFGLKVLAYDLYPRRVLADVIGFEYLPLKELLEKSDIVSLHCPATKENHHLIRSETIAMMKKGAVLINTARGTLVNTHDLLKALESRQISGAGLDVFDGEQAVKEDVELSSVADQQQLIAAIEAHRLLMREDVIVTPHNAFNSHEAVQRILNTTVENIRTFAETGKPAFPVPGS